MRKNPALVFATCLGICFLLFLCFEYGQWRVHALRTLCWSIANDLVTNTNSERVALIDSWSATSFSTFLAGAANIEAVKLGDKPQDLFSLQEHAIARLCFTNPWSKHFEIRIRRVYSATNFTVIGVGLD